METISERVSMSNVRCMDHVHLGLAVEATQHNSVMLQLQKVGSS